MSTNWSSSPPRKGRLLTWLVRFNTQVSQWASSLSWWRLIVLFLVMLIAGAIIGDLLHLKHDRVRIVRSGSESVMTIGGPDGIRIVVGPRKNHGPAQLPGAVPEGRASPPAP